jgi:hypothetical protein
LEQLYDALMLGNSQTLSAAEADTPWEAAGSAEAALSLVAALLKAQPGMRPAGAST